jgi:cytochrome c oxidase subunit 3
MAVETIKTKVKKSKLIGTRSKPKGFGGSGGGGDDGGGNNGGTHDSDHYYPSGESAYPSNVSRILTWFLLLVVLMTFGGLMGAYIVISTNGVAEWKPFNLPFQLWVSTALILSSSFTYTVAQRALYDGNHQKSKNWLLATTVLGAMFISSQLLAWFELVKRGVYMQSNPYAGFFYIITALHALHVAGGIVALGYIVLRTWNETDGTQELTKRKEIASAVGWYWHFMDGLWIVLLLMLGFWK